MFGTLSGPTRGTLGTFGSPSCTAAGAGSTCTEAVTYTPNSNYFGSDSFTYKTNDGSADSAPATVTLTVVQTNQPPNAVDDAYTTDQDLALTVPEPGVLTDDTDSDGNAL